LSRSELGGGSPLLQQDSLQQILLGRLNQWRWEAWKLGTHGQKGGVRKHHGRMSHGRLRFR